MEQEITKDIIMKLVDELVVKNITTVASKIFSTGTDLYKEYNISFGDGLKKYYNSVLDKYLYIKTIIDSNQKISLYQLYVPIDLEQSKKQIHTDDVSNIFNMSKHIVIIGYGGAGKSTLTKALFLDSIKKKYKIPILIELRNLNYDGDLPKSIVEYLSTYNLNISKNLLTSLLEKGSFTIFFDGLDEMEVTVQEGFSRKIQDFRDTYHLNNIALLSRPFQFSKSFESFDIYKIKKLKLDQAITLIQKINYDNDVKNQFIDRLKKGLYNKHESFTSNPLLLTIMLMTFSQYAEIPEKVHVFYQQAFEALYQRHDSTKGKVFHRKTYCRLSMFDFEKFFSFFCFITLFDNQISFTNEQINNYISKTLNFYKDIKITSENFLNDSVQNFCLLCNEGFEYLFIHRSFQEYFCAKFITTQLSEDKLEQVLKSFGEKNESRAMFELVYDMKPLIFEKYYILPSILKIIEEKENSKSVADYISKNVFKSILVSHDASSLVMFNTSLDNNTNMLSKNLNTLCFISRLYKYKDLFYVKNKEELPSTIKKIKMNSKYKGSDVFLEITSSSNTFGSTLENYLVNLNKFYNIYIYNLKNDIEKRISDANSTIADLLS